MDGRCVYLFLSIFIISFLSVTNGNKIYIKDSLKVKPFDDRLGTNQLYSIVVNALATRYKNRKMLEVSKSRYAFHMAWRRIRNFFWEKALNFFCPSMIRELKAVRELKKALLQNNNTNATKNKFGFTIPFENSQKKRKKKTGEEESDEESGEKIDGRSDEESDEESGEKSDGRSDEESDEESNRKRNKVKDLKGKNNKKKKDSDEDDDNSDSDEENKKKKKTGKISLDDLFD